MKLSQGHVDRIIANKSLITRVVFSYDGVIKLRHLGVHLYVVKDEVIRKIDAFKLRAKFQNIDPSQIHLFLFGDDTYVESLVEVTGDRISLIDRRETAVLRHQRAKEGVHAAHKKTTIST